MIQDAPPEISKEIEKVESRLDNSLIKQIACLELGVSGYTSEKSIWESMGISSARYYGLKGKRRNEIEKWKEVHNEGKYWILNEIKERAKLVNVMREALVNGDMETGKRLAEALSIMEAAASTARLTKMYELDKEEGGQKGVKSATQINIGNVDALKEAEKHIAQIKSK